MSSEPSSRMSLAEATLRLFMSSVLEGFPSSDTYRRGQEFLWDLRYLHKISELWGSEWDSTTTSLKEEIDRSKAEVRLEMWITDSTCTQNAKTDIRFGETSDRGSRRHCPLEPHRTHTTTSRCPSPATSTINTPREGRRQRERDERPSTVRRTRGRAAGTACDGACQACATVRAAAGR